jgi:ankyrin repeat protein
MEIFGLIASGDVEGVRALLARDPAQAAAHDEQGVSALLRARYRWNDELVEALLEADPPLDEFDAAAFGVVDRLGDPAAYSGDGFTPLHLAVFFGRLEAARTLIERGADVHAVSRNGLAVPPLQSAVAAGERELAHLLLDAGAVPDARNLAAADQNGDTAMAALLREYGAEDD